MEKAAVEHVGEPAPIEDEAEQAISTPAELVVLGLATLLDAFEKELEAGESTQALFVLPSGEVLDVEGFGSALPDFVYFDGRDDEGRDRHDEAQREAGRQKRRIAAGPRLATRGQPDERHLRRETGE